jgi:hypothetical protein
MLDINWRIVLKYLLAIAISILVLVVIKLSWSYVKGSSKKEGFTVSDDYGTEFDYVKSFINSLSK